MLRNGAFPCAELLKGANVSFETLDYLYENSRNYDTLAQKIVKEVRRREKDGEVCYVVDGGVSEDRAAKILLSRKNTRAINGVSKGEWAATKAGLYGGYLSLSAYEVEGKPLTLPLVVYDLADRNKAGDLKLNLTELFGDEAKACFVANGKAKQIPLYETDRQTGYGATCALVVYEIPLLEKKRFCFEDFVAILRRLRAPDGCPWDRVQTHESIRINLIEEAYELVDAIDSKEPEKMCEEAGDVLMQAIFHTLIEEERGGFSLTDMVSGVCEKLISRHTHVFGQDGAIGAEGALSVWEKNKMIEKRQTTFADAVNDVPQGFPALLRAQKVCKRVEKGGLSSPDFETLASNLQEGVEKLKGAKDKAEAVSDLLMTAVQMGRAAGVDCEQALLDKVKKLQVQFTAFEGLVRADGKDVNALTKEERARYLNEAKNVARA